MKNMQFLYLLLSWFFCFPPADDMISYLSGKFFVCYLEKKRSFYLQIAGL